MIKIYTELEEIKNIGNSNLFPLLEVLIFESETTISSYYSISEEYQDADVLILPYFYDYLVRIKKQELYKKFLRLSIQDNKPLWIAMGGDLPLKLNHKNVHVFKMADFKSKILNQNYIMPVFIGDPIYRFYNDNFEVQSKSEVPKIGYVGHAKNGFVKSLRTIYIYLNYNFKIIFGKIISDFSPLYFSSHIRFKYLKIFEKSTLLNCNFIYRDRYKAGAKTKLEIDNATTDFYQNIKDTQYTFCIRGGGNFSVRLYETMAMGRIPIQIDTDCVLPLEDIIDWQSHILIIKEEDIANADAIIQKFHKSFTELAFQNFQFKVRQFWKDNLTRENYFIQFHNFYLSQKS